jgi:D-glycero-alpha-D-manno-heptose-7-phosphate kinase
MIITQTPVRVSFLGGGTDYPEYFRHHGGATLVTTINRYTLVTVHQLTQFVEHSLRIHYSQVESVRKLEEIKHPSARACLEFLGIQGGVEIHYVNDLPARTGLGSSSSATVGLLMALHAFRGEMVSRERVAEEAVYVEHEMLKERVGYQDQYASALGGFQHLEFQRDGTVRANPIVLERERQRALERRLLLLYTGIQRHAHEVLDEQLERTRSGDALAQLDGLKALVREGVEVITRGRDLADFGALLHAGWMLKRALSGRVTTPWIDDLYTRARAAGAVGGKLLGAGGGGFLLLYVEPDHQDRVQAALPELRPVKFAFENAGSTVIFYRP